MSRRHLLCSSIETTISPKGTFVTVARLDIPAQEIDQAGQAAYGEGLAFSPWRTLHVGSMRE
jgi:hypothetical protein